MIPREYQRFNLNRKYTLGEVSLIAETDRLHNNSSGPSLVATLKRMYEIYQKEGYKNGSVIRKMLGYGFIERDKFEDVNKFYDIYNEYINYHRPSSFYTEVDVGNGKIKKVYKHEDYMTPYQRLTMLEGYEKLLKNGYTKEKLSEIANRYDDNDYAKKVQRAKSEMFRSFEIPKKILVL